MSPPGPTQEVPIPAVNPVSGNNLPHIPRKWVRDAIRVCLDLGYTVTGAQAWRLIKDFREWRQGDAHEFIAAEFRTYVQRRGDLMQVRGKRHHDWRLRS